MLEILKEYQSKGLLFSQVHPSLPLSIWNYSDKCQWENLWDDITLSCRGLVVDDLGNVVARPFRKFFNLSEGKTNATVDYEIYTKYDGSLGILFFYGESWIFTSRGSFTSNQAVKGFELLSNYDYTLLDKENTYCFEIIYPENKIVVNYGEYEDVILTGVFNTKTGEEKPLNCWLIPHARTHKNSTSLEKLQEIVQNDEEGYVIRFSNGERCKIKGVEYLRLHKMMSEMSTTAVWECLRKGDSVLELIHDFPDEFFQLVKDQETFLKEEFNYTKELVETSYIRFSKIEDIKEFALAIENHIYKHFFFSLRNGRDITDSLWRWIKPKYRKL